LKAKIKKENHKSKEKRHNATKIGDSNSRMQKQEEEESHRGKEGEQNSYGASGEGKILL
jgi:hypothetical protein